MTVAGKTDTFLSEVIWSGGRVGKVARPAIGSQQVRILIFVHVCRLTLIVAFFAGQEFNKALPSGLVAEERTRQLLEIVVGKRGSGSLCLRKT